MLNKYLCVGNLVRDPEVKYTQSGTAVCEFSLAINRTYVVNGEKRKETSFIDFKCWGKIGEALSNWFHKGDPIFIEGRLQQDTWDDRETGKKRSKVYVNVDKWEFLPGRGSDSGQAQQSSQTRPADQSQQAQQSRPEPSQGAPVNDKWDDAGKPGTEDDLPF